MNTASGYGFDILNKAAAFAAAAHGAVGQTRKYSGEAYIAHPMRVATLILEQPGWTWEQICAAWLHDVVEDTKVELQLIIDHFGLKVGTYVDALTNVPSETASRADRMEINRQRLAAAPREVQEIKCADIFDNARDIALLDPRFARIWLPEKEATLALLTKARPRLLELASNRVVDQLARLEVEQVA